MQTGHSPSVWKLAAAYRHTQSTVGMDVNLERPFSASLQFSGAPGGQYDGSNVNSARAGTRNARGCLRCVRTSAVHRHRCVRPSAAHRHRCVRPSAVHKHRCVRPSAVRKHRCVRTLAVRKHRCVRTLAVHKHRRRARGSARNRLQFLQRWPREGDAIAMTMNAVKPTQPTFQLRGDNCLYCSGVSTICAPW